MLPSRSKPRQGMVTVRSETLYQHGDTVQMQVQTAKLVVPRRRLSRPRARPQYRPSPGSTSTARKSLTLVRVGPVSSRSPRPAKKP